MGPGPRPVWAVEDGAVYDGSFRANIGAFLGHYGSFIAVTCPTLRAWTVEVFDKGHSNPQLVTLYIYEDTAAPEEPPVCDQCRIIGEQLSASGCVKLCPFLHDPVCEEPQQMSSYWSIGGSIAKLAAPGKPAFCF